MRFRVIAGMATLGLSVSSFASFELALISDNTTKTIHRYDVDSGVYLGSFGANRLTGTVGSVCIDQSINAAYVADGSSIKKFDYNTGEYLGFMTVTGPIRQMNLANDGRLIVANTAAGAGPNIYTFGSTTPTTTPGYNTTTIVAAGIQSQNGGYNDLLNDTSIYRLVGRSNPANIPTSYVAGGSATGVDMAGRNNRLSYVFSGGWFTWGIASTTAAGGVVGLSFASAPTLTAGYSLTGTSFGHVDAYAVATNGTASQMGFFDIANFNVTVRNLPSQIQNARDVAVVVAPEPASMLALGSGIALLIRRRRNRR